MQIRIKPIRLEDRVEVLERRVERLEKICCGGEGRCSKSC
ncbi:hypothetical protein GACE_2301 [Geoglobus acetivorans]|uniref:Uncharacterized protein n=1 Tax=Geoglobus acetivorans TaxID=565033 RepID=A0A0A7GJI1_GEOAI|nr:hypothetical protein GACE_2301 [Geoglobus acetivorans]